MAHHTGRRASSFCFAVGLGAVLAAGGCGGKKLDLGDRLLGEGKPAEAIAVWRTHLAQRPSDTRLLIRIATAQTRLGKLDDAEATMLRAVDIAPDSPKVRHNLGLVYLKQKNFDKALATFHETLELQDTYPETNFWIGLIHETHLGDEKTAEAYYIRDVNNGPSRAWDRLILMKREKRKQGLLRSPPKSRHVVAFSLVVLVLAACIYGIRLYLEKRHGPPPGRDELVERWGD